MVLATWWLYDTIGYGALVAVVVLIVPLAAFWTYVSLLLPHGDAHWKALLPGAFLMATGLQLLHVLTLWLVAPKLDRSESLYGPLGAVATLLFWMYLAGRLVVTAPVLNVALHEERRRKRGDLSVPPPAVPLGRADPAAQGGRAADGEAPEGGSGA
jgi:uncharacterized BrkB/YihY/UPF0761 family membrane protein